MENANTYSGTDPPLRPVWLVATQVSSSVEDCAESCVGLKPALVLKVS